MAWKHLGWYLLRLAIAGILLAIDLRLFLFYAFILFLQTMYALDRLRAIVRVFQVANEVKLMTIAETLHISETDLEARLRKETDSWNRQTNQAVDADLAFATARNLFGFRQP